MNLKKYLKLVKNINNVSELYSTFLCNDYPEYIKVLIEHNCPLTLIKIEVDRIRLELETLMLLEPLENYEDFLLLNREYFSRKEEIKRYIDNIF